METRPDRKPKDQPFMSGPEVTVEFTSKSPAQDADSFAPERKVVEGSRPRLAVETQA